MATTIANNGRLIDDIDRFHDAILDYLDSSGFTKAADSLRSELGRAHTATRNVIVPRLLEKKWLASTKLQIGLLYHKNELQRKQELQTAFNALLGIKSTQDTTPNDARDLCTLDWKVEAANIALSSTCPIMVAAISPEKSNIKFFRTDGRSIVASNQIAHLKVPIAGGGTSVVAFAPDGLRVLMAARGRVYLFQLDANTNEYILQDQFLEVTPGDKDVTAVLPWCPPETWAFSALQICTVTADTVVQTWDWKENRCTKEILNLKVNSRIKSQCIVESATDIYLILGFDNGKISKFVLLSDSNANETASTSTDIQAHDRAVDCLISLRQTSTQTTDEKCPSFISSGRDKAIRIWNAVKMECLQQLDGHSNWVRALAIHPSNNLLASSSDDRTLRFWDLKTGREVKKLIDVPTFAEKMFFDCNGRHLIVVSSSQTVEVWNCSRVVSLKGDEPIALLGNSNSQFSTPSRMSPYSTADSSPINDSIDISIRRPRLGVGKTPPEKDRPSLARYSGLPREGQDEFIARLNSNRPSKSPNRTTVLTGSSGHKLGITSLNMRKVTDSSATTPRTDEGAGENLIASARIRTARLPNTGRAKSPLNLQRLTQKSSFIIPAPRSESNKDNIADKSIPTSGVTTDSSLPSKTSDIIKSLDLEPETIMKSRIHNNPSRKESTDTADYSATFIPNIDSSERISIDLPNQVRRSTEELSDPLANTVRDNWSNPGDKTTEKGSESMPMERAEISKLPDSQSGVRPLSKVSSGTRRGSVLTKSIGQVLGERRPSELPAKCSSESSRKYSEGLLSPQSTTSTQEPINRNRSFNTLKTPGPGKLTNQQPAVSSTSGLAKCGGATRTLTKASPTTNTLNPTLSAEQTTAGGGMGVAGVPSFMSGIKKGLEPRKVSTGPAARRSSMQPTTDLARAIQQTSVPLSGPTSGDEVGHTRIPTSDDIMLGQQEEQVADEAGGASKSSIGAIFRKGTILGGPTTVAAAQRLLGRSKLNVAPSAPSKK